MTTCSEDRKMELVLEWQVSGQSRRKFSHEHGIVYTTFCTWCRKVATGQENGNALAPAAMQIVQVGSINLTMQRQVASGVHLEVGWAKVMLDTDFCPQTLAQVLEVLKQC